MNKSLNFCAQKWPKLNFRKKQPELTYRMPLVMDLKGYF